MNASSLDLRLNGLATHDTISKMIEALDRSVVPHRVIETLEENSRKACSKGRSSKFMSPQRHQVKRHKSHRAYRAIHQSFSC